MDSKRGMTFESLTGIELRKLKEALGRPLEKAAQDGDIEVAYALEWVRQTRIDPSVTYEQVLAVPIGQVIHHLETVTEEDPTDARSGGT